MEQKRCYGCMRIKGQERVCPHCGFDERTPNAPHQLPLGTVLREQYVVGRVLGQGGFGITYLGWDRHLDTPVAIKEYYPTGAVMRKSLKDPGVVLCPGAEEAIFRSGRERFLREAQTLARYAHVRELVRVNSFFPENNTAYMVMEYVEGITLREYVKRRGGRLPCRETLAILRPIVTALGNIHREGLIHRDISPDSIMMLRGGAVKLLDFGSVRNAGKGQNQSSVISARRGFAPVEQYQQNVALGPWTDVYALCATLYYCVTGQVPPDATQRMLGNAVLNFDGAPELTQQQRQVIGKGMAVKSADRYLSMEELHRALFQPPAANTAPYAMTGGSEPGSTVAVVSSQPERTAAINPDGGGAVIEPPKRKPWVAALLLVVLLAVGGAALWYLNGTGGASLADRGVTTPSVELDIPVFTRGNPLEDTEATEATEPEDTQPAQIPVIKDPRENTLAVHREAGKEVTPQSSAFGTTVTREQVKTITVLYSIQNAPEDAVDVSQQQNGKVLAWTVPNGELYDLYLAAEGGIYAPADSMQLFGYFTNVQKIEFNGVFFTDNVVDASGMFYKDEKLVEMDVSGFRTANMTNMSFMFSYCYLLEKLDVSCFDTAKVTDMNTMFQRCESLRTLDVSGFDTANVTDMQYMFNGVKYVPVLDVSGFDTAKVTNMMCMFHECGAVKELDVSGFDTDKVTSMAAMFRGCAAVEELDISGFDTTKVNNMNSMFSGCTSLQILTVSPDINTVRVTDMEAMFRDCATLKALDVSGFDTANVISMDSMFSGCQSLLKLDVAGFDTKNVSDMGFMFSQCNALTALDVSGFNTAKVTDMECMFQDCRNVTALAVDNFNTREVQNMGRMFLDCSSLQSLNVSRFRTEKVEDMQYMFAGCSGLRELDVSGFATGRVTTMEGMFENCWGLSYLKLTRFNTANVQSMAKMFSGCAGLNYLDLGSFNTARVTDMEQMFFECRSLKSLDLTAFDTSAVRNMSRMLYGCDELKNLTLGTFSTASVTEWDDFMEPGKKVGGKDWTILFN